MHVSYDIRIKVQQVTEMANSVEHVKSDLRILIPTTGEDPEIFSGPREDFILWGWPATPLK